MRSIQTTHSPPIPRWNGHHVLTHCIYQWVTRSAVSQIKWIVFYLHNILSFAIVLSTKWKDGKTFIYCLCANKFGHYALITTRIPFFRKWKKEKVKLFFSISKRECLRWMKGMWYSVASKWWKWIYFVDANSFWLATHRHDVGFEKKSEERKMIWFRVLNMNYLPLYKTMIAIS